MARVATVFRWVISTIWTILIVPFLVLAWRGVLDRGDVEKHPVDWLMGWLASFSQIPGIYASALIATGVLVGVWSDWLLRRFDGSRADRRITLGYKFSSLSESVETRLRNNMYQPDNPHRNQWGGFIHDLVPSITSAFITARKFGIWTPTGKIYERRDAGFVLVNYLDHVGTLLKDGHFKQAKEYAQQCETALKL